MISAAAACLGALIGGTFTLLVAMHSDDSTRSDQRRAERRDAYSKYYGDAAALAKPNHARDRQNIGGEDDEAYRYQGAFGHHR
ncbi:MAG: hypothetical protein ACR2N4_14945 [Jatrophihabitans sp.]